MTDARPPVSAARLAEELGEGVPGPETIPPAALDLVARTRDLVAAVASTAVDDDVLADAARTVAAVTETLGSVRREVPVYLVRHPDGRLESLLQAGSGRLNPQAPPIDWIERPAEPPPGSPPQPATVRASCVFTSAHAGSPGRVHGGVLAATLDEVLGNAVTASGASGLTVALSVSYRGATPIGVPVEIVGRYDRHEGRKSFAVGEVLVDGIITVTAEALYVAERRDG